jgi:hypothetical protein
MIKHAFGRLTLVLFLAVIPVTMAVAIPRDDDGDEHHSGSSSGSTAVYVQTSGGIAVFQAASNGALTPVAGSPFAIAGNLVGTSGGFLVSLDGTKLYSYQLAANGAVGAQVSTVDASGYSGGNCGDTHGGTLDPSGKYVEVLYNPNIYVASPCTAYQTFSISTTGALTFLGAAIADMNIAAYLGPLALTGNGQFGFALDTGSESAVYAGFTRDSGGALADLSFGESDPQPPAPFDWFAWMAAADGSNHLALALGKLEYFGSPLVNVGATQLASYTVDASGNITSTNTYDQMPVPDVGPTVMSISPDSTVLAVGGGPCNWCTVSVSIAANGLELYHFNGAAPITAFTGVLNNDPIDQLAWDSNHHLFALSDESGKLYVYTASSTGVTAVRGSPYTVANPNGASPNGLAVVSTAASTSGRHHHNDGRHDDGEDRGDRRGDD